MNFQSPHPAQGKTKSALFTALLHGVLFTAFIIAFDGWTGRGISYIIGRGLVSGLIYASGTFLFRRYR
jgi:hypothetical protein